MHAVVVTVDRDDPEILAVFMLTDSQFAIFEESNCSAETLASFGLEPVESSECWLGYPGESPAEERMKKLGVRSTKYGGSQG